MKTEGRLAQLPIGLSSFLGVEVRHLGSSKGENLTEIPLYAISWICVE